MTYCNHIWKHMLILPSSVDPHGEPMGHAELSRVTPDSEPEVLGAVEPSGGGMGAA